MAFIDKLMASRESPAKDNVLISVAGVCYGLGIMCGFYFGSLFTGSRLEKRILDNVAFDICNEIEVRTQYAECLQNVHQRYTNYDKYKPKYNSLNRPSP